MGIKDLRSFLEILKENGLLYEVQKEVDWNLEAGSVIATAQNESGKTVLFDHIKDRDGFRLCGGVLGSMDQVSLAMDCAKNEISPKIMNCLEHPIDPVIVEKGACQENVLMGSDADLYKLPVPKHAPKDGGPVITGGICFSRSIHGGRHNMGYNRMHIKDKETTGICINEWRHLKEFHEEARKEGKALPVAIVSGADPALYIAAGMRYDGEEISIAGAIRGKAVEVVKCVTCDIYVPAHAEVVIEGEILPEDLDYEGPLGEFTGHYGKPWLSPVFKVKAITYRKDPIFQTINGGSFEHINLGNVVPREPLLLKYTRYVSDGVTAVHIPPYGSGFLAIVQMKKKNPGEPKNVVLAAMTSHVNIKNVIVVDEDVDIYDPNDILWALSTRVIPGEDIFTIKNAQGHEMDPGSDKRGVQTKMGIDATLSEGNKSFERVIYPKVNLKDYLQ